MAKYEDFKSYIQANYEDLLVKEVTAYVKANHDGQGFHSLNVVSLLEQKVENLTVESLRCHDDIGYYISIDVNLSADIITSGLGSDQYTADSKKRWFTVYLRAQLHNGLYDVNVYDTQEYHRSEFQKAGALDEFLLPYLYAEDLEEEAQDFTDYYCNDALTEFWEFPVNDVFREMGIRYYKAPLPKNEFGRMYFRNAIIDVYERVPYALRRVYRDMDEHELVEKEITPGTMLINKDSNFMNLQGDDLLTIAHEIIHWEKHQKFFELLALLNEDDHMSCDASPQTSVGNLKGIQSAIWWAEWQANALAPRILMPRDPFCYAFEKAYAEQECIPHFLTGEVMERTIDVVSIQFKVPKNLVKLRALQLGYKDAEGAYLKVGNYYHMPFTFNPAALDDRQTFIIDRKNFDRIYAANEGFRNLIDSGDFIYDGCLVCMNDPLYINEASEKDPMAGKFTDFALEHVDACCLKFDRLFTAIQSTGDYYDLCYLSKDVSSSDFEETREPNEVDTQDKQERKKEMAKIRMEANRMENKALDLHGSFGKTLQDHIDRKDISYADLERRSWITEKTIRGYRNQTSLKPDKGHVLALCIGLNLHSAYSFDLLRKAGHSITEPLTAENILLQELVINHSDETITRWNEKLVEWKLDLRLPDTKTYNKEVAKAKKAKEKEKNK